MFSKPLYNIYRCIEYILRNDATTSRKKRFPFNSSENDENAVPSPTLTNFFFPPWASAGIVEIKLEINRGAAFRAGFKSV